MENNLYPILPPSERAALESLVESGKTTVASGGNLVWNDDGTAFAKTVEVEATDAQIRQAKIRLQRDDERIRRIEKERREHERLKKRAALPEVEVLEELRGKLAAAKAEMKAMPSETGLAKAERALLETEAAHLT